MRRRQRVPVLRQMDAVDCGAACLAMILGYHGHATSVRESRTRCGIGRDGVTADTLMRVAHDYGLETRALSVPQGGLHGVEFPAVVHWNFSHYVVVERWRAKHVDIVDPASGPRRLTHSEFDECFTGVALLFRPGVDFKRCEERASRAWIEYLRNIHGRRQGGSCSAFDSIPDVADIRSFLARAH
jgi:ATP-binding cassette, subfamily B, bacterial